MKNPFFITITFLLFLSHSTGLSQTGAEEILVVSLKGTKERISEKTLRKIYLKRKVLWGDNSRIVPVNLPAISNLRVQFADKILGLSHRDLVDYWNEQHFQGIRPPEVVQSEEAVKIFVREVDGAIGYISSKNLDPDLTVLYRIKWD